MAPRSIRVAWGPENARITLLRVLGLGKQRRFLHGDAMRAEPVRGRDEGTEQRVRLERLRLEFRMELAAEVIRMIFDLADLDIRVVGRLAGNLQPTARQH